MKKLNLSEIIGNKFENEVCSAVVTRFDPVAEVFFLDGWDKKHKDHIVFYSGNLLEFGVEVAYTDQEKEMIQKAKLTHVVREKSEELEEAMTAWLNSPPSGR